MVVLTSILREAWNTAANSQDKREKIQALSLAKECYAMKLDLLTNATVVKDAIRFVDERTKDKKQEITLSDDNCMNQDINSNKKVDERGYTTSTTYNKQQNILVLIGI